MATVFERTRTDRTAEGKILIPLKDVKIIAEKRQTNTHVVTKCDSVRKTMRDFGGSLI